MPSENLETGKTYTVKELISRMLMYSDNQAYGLLVKNIELSDLVRVYKDFGINLDGLGKTDEIVNVQNYSAFFRILYNSSYLSRDHSEELLSILSKSDFKFGITGSIPECLTVSHKFGERGSVSSSEKQFSDCGIVYYPNHPYLLCVMTKGMNTDKQLSAIRQVSEKIYQEINRQTPN
jgi:beta-lactamase class A